MKAGVAETEEIRKASAHSKISGLERLLAALLHYGTWLASAVTAIGLSLALAGFRSGTQIATAGIALFILLPISRVILMLIIFAKQRDYRFVAVATLVLLVITAGIVLGMLTSKAAG